MLWSHAGLLSPQRAPKTELTWIGMVSRMSQRGPGISCAPFGSQSDSFKGSSLLWKKKGMKQKWYNEAKRWENVNIKGRTLRESASLSLKVFFKTHLKWSFGVTKRKIFFFLLRFAFCRTKVELCRTLFIDENIILRTRCSGTKHVLSGQTEPVV